MGDALIVRRTISGGGLSSTDAVLIVSVPTGASVTATKSGTTLTPTLWVKYSDNSYSSAIFSVSANTFDANAWTVTATHGANSESKTVVIDSNKEYEMYLLYQYIIYDSGVVTSGLTTTITNTNGTATLGSNYISFTMNSGNSQPRVVFYPIDLTLYSTLEADFHGPTNSNFNAVYAVYITNTPSTSVWSSSYKKQDVAVNANATVQMDISSYSGVYYVGVASTTNNASWANARSGGYCSKIRVF